MKRHEMENVKLTRVISDMLENENFPCEEDFIVVGVSRRMLLGYGLGGKFKQILFV